MGGASAICTARVAELKQALVSVHALVLSYLQFHYMVLAPYPRPVRKELLAAINAGLDEFTHDLAGQAGILHTPAAPHPPVSGSPWQPHGSRGSERCSRRALQTASLPAPPCGDRRGGRQGGPEAISASPRPGQEARRRPPSRGSQPRGRGAAPSRRAWWRGTRRLACANTRGAACPATGPPARSLTIRSPLLPTRGLRRLPPPRRPPRHSIWDICSKYHYLI